MSHFIKMLIWLGVMAVIGLVGLIVADHVITEEEPQVVDIPQESFFSPFDN